MKTTHPHLQVATERDRRGLLAGGAPSSGSGVHCPGTHLVGDMLLDRAGRLGIVGLLCMAQREGWAQAQAEKNVAVQMQHVAFHVDSTIIMHIGYLRGALQPVSQDQSPYFDDKHSFVLAID